MLFSVPFLVSFLGNCESISCLLQADSPKWKPLWFGNLFCRIKTNPWGFPKSKLCIFSDWCHFFCDCFLYLPLKMLWFEYVIRWCLSDYSELSPTTISFFLRFFLRFSLTKRSPSSEMIFKIIKVMLRISAPLFEVGLLYLRYQNNKGKLTYSICVSSF